MSLVTLMVLGAIIGSNNLAASLALGTQGQAHLKWRVALVFGLFEFFIPLVGLWLGKQVSGWIIDQAGWIGPLLIAGMGVWSLYAGIHHEPEDQEMARKATTWRGLFLLAAGLSLDNLVVGFSLGLRQLNPIQVAAIIAAFSVTFSLLGMDIGGRVRRHYDRQAEIGSGVLLIGLAVAAWRGWI